MWSPRVARQHAQSHHIRMAAPRKWPLRLELALFEAMARVRPVGKSPDSLLKRDWMCVGGGLTLECCLHGLGMHRHFAIVDIARSLQDLAPEITPAIVWDHLSTMYNLEALVSFQAARTRLSCLLTEGRMKTSRTRFRLLCTATRTTRSFKSSCFLWSLDSRRRWSSRAAPASKVRLQ
jgi:hypothetical protein